MKKIKLKQGSQEWLDFRKTRIGASDFPVIIKKNPYGSLLEVYRSKVDLLYNTELNHNMLRGIENEDEAREEFESQMRVKYPPLVTVKEDCDRFMASLDGYNEKYNELVEIKVPSAENFDKYRHNPPEYCLYQVFWQLYVTGAVTGYLFFYSPERKKGHIHTINPNTKEVETYLDKLNYFIECIDAKKEPVKLMNLPLVVNNPKLEDTCQEYFRIKNQVARLTDQLDTLKREIIASSQDENVKAGPYLIKKREIYRVDYKKACEENTVDLTPYKKEPTESWHITQEKG